jgi:hypothetical protein
MPLISYAGQSHEPMKQPVKTVLTQSRPGLRDRFVFSQHDYCGNIFWYRLLNDLKVDTLFDSG